jgi:hypothetical protein
MVSATFPEFISSADRQQPPPVAANRFSPSKARAVHLPNYQSSMVEIIRLPLPFRRNLNCCSSPARIFRISAVNIPKLT